ARPSPVGRTPAAVAGGACRPERPRRAVTVGLPEALRLALPAGAGALLTRPRDEGDDAPRRPSHPATPSGRGDRPPWRPLLLRETLTATMSAGRSGPPVARDPSQRGVLTGFRESRASPGCHGGA